MILILPVCRRALACMIAVAFFLPLAAQSFIHRYRSPAGTLYYTSVRPMSDGRIIAGGSITTISERATAVMLDAEGAVLWSRFYGGQTVSEAWSIFDYAETASGDVLTLINAVDNDNVYSNLVRFSAQNGAILDARRFGDADRYAAYSRIDRISDGFILSGSIGFEAQRTGFSLVKTDFNGNILWQRSVKNPEIIGTLQASVEAENGDIWSVTALESPFAVLGRAGLLHFNASGELLAAYDVSAADPLRLLLGISIAWQPGVGPVLGSYYYRNGPENILPLITQFDEDGQVLWSKALNTTPSSYILPFVHTLPDGNLLAACGSGGAPNLGVLVKLDAGGDVVWMRDLTTELGVESLLAANIDDKGILYGTGIVFAPLPALDRKGFVFKTDDPRYDEASCCTRALSGQTFNAPVQVTNLPLSSGELIDVVPATIPQTSAVTQRETVCLTEAPPQVMWSDSSVCPGECVTLRLDPPGTKVYNLSAPGISPSPIQVSDTASICFPEEGTYTFQLDDGDCIRTEFSYTVRQRTPEAATLSDTLICPGRCVTLTAPETEDAENYVWTFPGGQPNAFSGPTPPEICYPKAGKYTLRLSIAGCGFSEQTLEVSSRPFLIPNAFTPNGDDNNDVFRPLLDCPEGTYRFEVYNRWGQRVFDTSDPEAGWNGDFNGQPAPSDVYVWKINFGQIDIDGIPTNRCDQGNVSLLR